MSKKIWLINHYASNMLFDKGGRHYYFAKYLNRNGYAPVVFCANMTGSAVVTKCFDNELLINTKMADEISTPFVFVKVRLYSGNGKERILNMIDFYRNVKKAMKEYARENGKPDIILASSVHPLTLLAGIQIAKEFGIKCICEVRDLWPESIIAYGGYNKDSILFRALYRGEKYIYRKADALIFTFEGGYNYIEDKGWSSSIPHNKVYYINNGVDLESYNENLKLYPYEDKDLEDKDTYKIIYTGSIRRVNNLGILLDAAKSMKNRKVRFLIWGDGDELRKLQQRIVDEKIDNVEFKGKVEKKYIPSIVSRATLNFAHCEATEMDYKYGISFNKIFDYLAAGKPVLCDVPTKYNPVIQEKAGFEIKTKSTKELAYEIDRITSISEEEYLDKAQNALIAAQKYDFSELTNKLINIIDGL